MAQSLPNSLEAEQAILGAMLADPRNMAKVTEELKPEDFFWEANREIYRVMVDMNDHSIPLDMVTLMNQLNQRGTLEAVGGLEYISGLMDMVTVQSNIDSHIGILREKTTLRMLAALSQELAGQVSDGKEASQTLVEAAEKKIFDIAMRRGEKDYVNFSDVMFKTYMDIERISHFKGQLVGVPSGFTDLDKITAGFQKSDLIILGGRPAMGKTSLALSMMYKMAVKNNIPVGFFSLEMAAGQVAQRILSMESNIPLGTIRGGGLNDNEWLKLQDAVRALDNPPIYIDDTGMITTREIRSKARKMKMEHNIQALFIDYLQFIQGAPESRQRGKQYEVADISRDLKNLAKELEIPVIALAQVGRSADGGSSDHRPSLSALRDSGAIEQDADIVCFIYRDEYYNKNTEKPGVGEIIIAKHRNGATATVEIAWLAEYTRYDNLIAK